MDDWPDNVTKAESNPLFFNSPYWIDLNQLFPALTSMQVSEVSDTFQRTVHAEAVSYWTKWRIFRLVRYVLHRFLKVLLSNKTDAIYIVVTRLLAYLCLSVNMTLSYYVSAVSNWTFCDEMLCNVFVSYILFLSKMSVHYIHMFLRLTKPEVSFIRSHEYGHLK